jgi:RNA polymerase sigma-70 factor (ECF subfamily)
VSNQNANREDVLRLFLQHQGMVSAFLFSLVEDWEIVEEALQDTAVFVCSRWEDFEPGTNFGAWVRTVARMRAREIIQRLRKTSSRMMPVVGVADAISEQEWAEHSNFSPRHKQNLAQCLEELPQQYREIIQLRYTRQLKCEQIAAQLERTAESLYMLLSRIRKRLKDCVEERLAEENR